MARTCPACGRQAIDDQSRFCNKCGAPFPEDQPKKTVVVRTTPRLADSPPPQQPLSPPPFEAPRAPLQSTREPPKVRVPARPQHKPAPPALPFRKFIAKGPIIPVYWLGVIAILLIVFAGITTSTTKSATAPGASANTTAKASDDLLAGIPLFWIGVMVFGNLLWRTVCELAAVQFALFDTLTSTGTSQNPDRDFLPEDDMEGLGGTDLGDSETCPRCGKPVEPGDLRTCAHCGVQGCSSCIRLMGLVRKTLTCRDCYQK